MTTPGAPLTTVHLWRVPPARVPGALARMGSDRLRLRRVPGLRFARLVGTGDGRTFDVRDADPTLWGLVAAWDDARALAAFERRSPIARGWARLATERWRADLALLTGHGAWGGTTDPFGAAPRRGEAPAGAARPRPREWAGPVAALTRARLTPGLWRTFWAAVPPVVADLAQAPGLLLRVGIGEAPVGLQGTFSVWRSAQDLTDFAYRTAAHRDAIRRTQELGWYQEELFARFAVLGTTGRLFGGDPLAATEARAGGSAESSARGSAEGPAEGSRAPAGRPGAD